MGGPEPPGARVRAAVTKLERRVTQEPVKTQFGYHVIQLEDSKPVEAPPFEGSRSRAFPSNFSNRT
ncbi:MAG: peptidyl-prolyl cis-trans isomerase [Betaproteobacteria bacterium]|nr:peptidyl-prolyl cis-trans isomerase [Betaproteobacteria bacterium]